MRRRLRLALLGLALLGIGLGGPATGQMLQGISNAVSGVVHSVWSTANTAEFTYSKTNVTNDTATCSAANCTSTGNDYWSVGTKSVATGKCYFEIGITAQTNAIGLTNASNAPYTGALSAVGNLSGSTGLTNNGSMVTAGTSTNSFPTYAAGATVGFAVDFTDGYVFVRNNSAPTVWNAGAGATPATPSTGYSISAIISTGLLIANASGFFAVGNGPVVLNTGGTTFGQAAPSGYTACW